MKTITTNSPEETMQIASEIAGKLSEGDFLALEGDLGAGKTVFVKGLAKGLGVEDHLHVNSPTFVILKEYAGRVDLYHFDVYRIDQEHFSDTLDYRKYFYGKGITVVEWADKIKDIFPEEYLEIVISHAGETSRRFEFLPHGERYEKLVNGES